jgi:hypothetical protein
VIFIKLGMNATPLQASLFFDIYFFINMNHITALRTFVMEATLEPRTVCFHVAIYFFETHATFVKAYFQDVKRYGCRTKRITIFSFQSDGYT